MKVATLESIPPLKPIIAVPSPTISFISLIALSITDFGFQFGLQLQTSKMKL